MPSTEERIEEGFFAGDEVAFEEATHVEAAFLAGLLQRTHQSLAALRVRGVQVTGALNLDNRSIDTPVVFQACNFLEPISARGARLRHLAIERCEINAVWAEGLRTDDSVVLDGTSVFGPLSFGRASIGGKFSAIGATLRPHAGHALDAAALTVDGDLLLADADVHGSVDIAWAEIRGQIVLTGATFRSDGPSALDLSSVRTGGHCGANGSLTVTGQMRMVGARIGGSLLLRGAVLRNRDAVALSANNLTVGQAIWADHLQVEGELDLTGASVGSQVRMEDSRIENRGRVAVRAGGTRIAQDLRLDRVTLRGLLRLTDASIGQSLVLRGATVSDGEDGCAVEADSLTAGSNVHLDTGFCASGEVRLVAARLRAQLLLRGATFDAGRSGTPALNATSARIDGDVLGNQSMTCLGEFRLTGASVGGQLSLRGAILKNPGGLALQADTLSVGGSVHLTDSFAAEGSVNFDAARLRSSLLIRTAVVSADEGVALFLGDAEIQSITVSDTHIRGTVLTHRLTVDADVTLRASRLEAWKGAALDMARAEVGGSLVIDAKTSVRGAIDLTGLSTGAAVDLACQLESQTDDFVLRLDEARVGTTLALDRVVADGPFSVVGAKCAVLRDQVANWKIGSDLNEFEYGTLERDRAVESRLQWLEQVSATGKSYLPQNYKQLASFYERRGMVEEARQVSLAKLRRRRRRLGLPARVASWLVDATVGYGLRKSRALIWLLGLIVVDSWLFHRAHEAGHIVAAHKGQSASFHAIGFALDTALPLVNLNQRAYFVVLGDARWIYWTSVLAGWALATILAAAFAGLLNRTE